MRGANPIRAQEKGDGQTLWVQEVFYTLQGEGPFTGQPAVFVRLAGCNLKCFFCDTDFESSDWRPSLTELLEQIEAVRSPVCNLVVITGGEPFRQNILPLVQSLLQSGLRVQIETNGTLWIDLPVSKNLHIVCSPKTTHLHPRLQARINSYKYVIAEGGVDPDDGLPSGCTQTPTADAYIARPLPGASVYVMPMDSFDPAQNQRNLEACLDSATRFGYTLTLQTHKLLGIR
jgi:organic radical activating enzyme